MKLFLKITFLLSIVFAGGRVYAAAITLDEKDATVWLPMQSITGRVLGSNAHNLKLYCNGVSYPVNINADSTFKVTVKLADGENKIWASAQQGNSTIKTNHLNLTLGYHPLPVARPYAIVAKGKVTLNATVTGNPSKQPLKFLWVAANGNPAACKIWDKNAPASQLTIPAKNGAYYFNLYVIAGADSARFQTYITRTKNGLHAYDMDKDHAAWIDSAVVYEITTDAFVKNGTYNDVTAKLAELKTLGINTLWLQPVYETGKGGQGYDVTNYFKLRDDLGTEAQLANLITSAKKLHMKVIFDFVPNHTSIDHPYALDCIKYGDSSHYYNFYQRTNDGKPYSSLYRKDKYGFMAYIWGDLVNLNYNNPEVQEWIIQATEHWVKKFDIDGYRFDAVWGINARTPQFEKRLQTELKSIKPDLLLLAEARASDKTIYKNGFDAAYDWTPDTVWISQWSWQTKYNKRKSLTIFNSPDTLHRSAMLRKAIFQSGDLSAIRLRFLENNDVPRFIASHDIDQTKMAAALLFSLPGIPMLYNGQETGCKWHPYSGKPVFNSQYTIQQSDSLGLFPYYKKLIQLHTQYPALNGKGISEVALLNSPYMLAFQRWEGDQHFIIIINLNQVAASAQLNYQTGDPKLPGKTYLKDVLTDNVYNISENGALNTKIPMQGYGIRWLLVQ
jgi:glycosidase